MPNTATTKMIECIIPILKVKNVDASIKYYTEILGFKKDWGTGDTASVSRDNFSIMLCQGEQGHPGTWIWIGVESIDVIYEEYKASGATIRQVSTNYPWACEMRVEDLDGHVLRIGGEPKED